MLKKQIEEPNTIDKKQAEAEAAYEAMKKEAAMKAQKEKEELIPTTIEPAIGVVDPVATTTIDTIMGGMNENKLNMEDNMEVLNKFHGGSINYQKF